MQSRSILAATAVAFVGLGCLAATEATASTTLTAASSASAASASFTVTGKSGTIAPQALASGSGSAGYSKTVSPAKLTPSGTFGILSLSGTVNNVSDKASSAGATAGSIASTGSATIGSLSAKINSPLGTALTVTSGKITSSATLTKTATANTPSSSVSIVNLSIVSPFFGINKTFSGTFGNSPKSMANYPLYQSKDGKVTVYLNYQVKKTTAGKVTGFTVSAVDLHVVNFSYAGQTVSGDLALATGSAQ
jgi:hypothetical protein